MVKKAIFCFLFYAVALYAPCKKQYISITNSKGEKIRVSMAEMNKAAEARGDNSHKKKEAAKEHLCKNRVFARDYTSQCGLHVRGQRENRISAVHNIQIWWRFLQTKKRKKSKQAYQEIDRDSIMHNPESEQERLYAARMIQKFWQSYIEQQNIKKRCMQYRAEQEQRMCQERIYDCAARTIQKKWHQYQAHDLIKKKEIQGKKEKSALILQSFFKKLLKKSSDHRAALLIEKKDNIPTKEKEMKGETLVTVTDTWISIGTNNTIKKRFAHKNVVTESKEAMQDQQYDFEDSIKPQLGCMPIFDINSFDTKNIVWGQKEAYVSPIKCTLLQTLFKNQSKDKGIGFLHYDIEENKLLAQGSHIWIYACIFLYCFVKIYKKYTPTALWKNIVCCYRKVIDLFCKESKYSDFINKRMLRLSRPNDYVLGGIAKRCANISKNDSTRNKKNKAFDLFVQKHQNLGFAKQFMMLMQEYGFDVHNITDSEVLSDNQKSELVHAFLRYTSLPTNCLYKTKKK